CAVEIADVAIVMHGAHGFQAERACVNERGRRVGVESLPNRLYAPDHLIRGNALTACDLETRIVQSMARAVDDAHWEVCLLGPMVRSKPEPSHGFRMRQDLIVTRRKAWYVRQANGTFRFRQREHWHEHRDEENGDDRS